MVIMAEIWWLVLMILIVDLGYVPLAQNVKESCVDETSQKKSASFDCGTESKISYVKVRSGTGSCLTPEGKRCFGLSPPVLVAKLSCYWRSSCVIDWPRNPIIIPENDDECVGQTPGFLELSYKCFRPDAIISKRNLPPKHKNPSSFLIDICSKLTDDGKSSKYELTGRQELSGIIRSHEIYPWDYSNTPRTCIVKVFWPADTKLVVSVQNLELGESDNLQIGNYTAEDLVSNKRVEFPGTSHEFNTIFNFSVGFYSNGGKGFVVCFKFTHNDDQSDKSACDEITNGGNIHFGETTTTSRFDFLSLLQATTKAPKVMAMPIPPEGPPVTINKKCEKKRTEKKKKRCYDKLMNKQRGSKKRRKKDRKKKTEKSKKNSDS